MSGLHSRSGAALELQPSPPASGPQGLWAEFLLPIPLGRSALWFLHWADPHSQGPADPPLLLEAWVQVPALPPFADPALSRGTQKSQPRLPYQGGHCLTAPASLCPSLKLTVLRLQTAAAHEIKSDALELEVTSGQRWDAEPSLLPHCFRDPASVSSRTPVAWSLVARPPHPTG